VCELIGEGVLYQVLVQDNRTGQRRALDARALFVFIGAELHVQWLGEQLTLDDHGFIVTGAAAIEAAEPQTWYLARRPSLFETSMPGIFAAGDVRSGSIKRVAAAVGEGSMTVRLVHEHLEILGMPAAR
jgi:thioredoxin reductase (NADPH)